MGFTASVQVRPFTMLTWGEMSESISMCEKEKDEFRVRKKLDASLPMSI